MNLLFATALFGCAGHGQLRGQPQPPENVMNIQITSTAFAEGQPIPAKYTCDGSDISPPLHGRTRPPTPKASRSSPTIPTRRSAPGCIGCFTICRRTRPHFRKTWPKPQFIAGNAKQGLNIWPRLGYGGPCPPPGKPHRYFFKLYALDTMLDLKPGATKKDLLKAMEGHVLAEGQLMGTYQRK